MPINLIIQAGIVDITNDSPRKSDIFLVDTNVWFWQTYTNASTTANPYQLRDYPNYLAQALMQGSTLSYSVLTLAELASIIERTELSIYNQSNGLNLKLKEYRHNYPSERANMVSEVQSAWSQVEAIAASADLKINDAIAKSALNRFQTQAVDGYDLLILESISRAGAGQVRVITDDMDYATVPNIQVFTSNRNVIQAASQQSKLLRR
jgi:hypothetical protein